MSVYRCKGEQGKFKKRVMSNWSEQSISHMVLLLYHVVLIILHRTIASVYLLSNVAYRKARWEWNMEENVYC